jgi:hypothetical protein
MLLVVGLISIIGASWSGMGAAVVEEVTANDVRYSDLADTGQGDDGEGAGEVGLVPELNAFPGSIVYSRLAAQGAVTITKAITIEGTVRAIELRGDYLFVGRDMALEVYDVTTAISPSLVSSLAIGSRIVMMSISQDTAYLVDDYGYMHQVDVSDPMTPAVAGAALLENYPRTMTVANGRMYAGESYSDDVPTGLRVSEIVSASQVSEIMHAPFAAYDVYDIYVDGDLVYAGLANDEGRGRLEVVDTESSTEWETSSVLVGMGDVTAIEGLSTTLIVGVSDMVSDTTRLMVLGNVDGEYHVEGDLVLATDATRGGVGTVDDIEGYGDRVVVGDSAPVEITSNDDFARAYGGFEFSVRLIDVGLSVWPIELASERVGWPIHGVAYKPGAVYVALGEGGIQVLEISGD